MKPFHTAAEKIARKNMYRSVENGSWIVSKTQPD
jgi:hypothetical protein